jgi:hypothetical protein
VIDHNTFTNPKSLQIHHRPEYTSHGNASWQRPLGLGGPDAIYIEDNTFSHASWNTSAPATDCDGGGRLVFRHNSVTNTYFEMHDAIVAGYRGCRKWEVYDNTFTVSPAGQGCGLIGVRGGTGVVFNNTFVGSTSCYPDEISMHLYRTYQTAGGSIWGSLCSTSSGKGCLNNVTGSPLYPCTSDAQCGGQANSCILIDGTSSNPSGYLCRDQTGSDLNNPQVSKPALFWNNKYGSTFVAPVVWGSTDERYLVSGRDWCAANTTMPATCNGQTTTYTPYTYPHPFVTGTTVLPNPPTDIELSLLRQLRRNSLPSWTSR